MGNLFHQQKTGNKMKKKTGGPVPTTKKGKESKPFIELVESVGWSKKESLVSIQLTEGPTPEERSSFFAFVEELAEKLKLIKLKKIVFAVKEVQLLFDCNVSLKSLESFIEELGLFIFPDKENGVIINNYITPL